MDKFDFLKHNFVKFIPTSSNNIKIYQYGYNDFKVVQPMFVTRVQSTFTLHFVFDGEGILNINDKTFEVKKYDLFFIPPNVKMSYYPKKENPWRYVWIMFYGANVQEEMEALKFSLESPIFHSRYGEMIEEELYNFFLYNKENHSANELFARSVFDKIKAFIKMERNQQYKSESFANNFIQLATNLIESNYYNSQFTIDKLSQMMHISHAYLCKLFKKELDISAVTYMIDYRLNRAKDLLAMNKTITVKEVALAVGYKDEFTLSKAFTAKFNMAPGRYRDNIIYEIRDEV